MKIKLRNRMKRKIWQTSSNWSISILTTCKKRVPKLQSQCHMLICYFHIDHVAAQICLFQFFKFWLGLCKICPVPSMDISAFPQSQHHVYELQVWITDGYFTYRIIHKKFFIQNNRCNHKCYDAKASHIDNRFNYARAYAVIDCSFHGADYNISILFAC